MAAVAASNSATDADTRVPLDTIPISPEGGNDENKNHNTTTDSKPVTVFHDPNNFNVKHPLANTWTLWFTKPPSGKVCASLVIRLESIDLLTFYF